MNKRARGNSSPNVQLFPFLAVLLCAMGGLIILLVVITGKNRAVGKMLGDIAVQERVALAEKRNELEWHVDMMDKARENTAQTLAGHRAALAMLEDKTRGLRDEIAELESAAKQIQQTSHAESVNAAQIERKISLLEVEADAKDKELKRLREATRKYEDSFAVVPYEGPHATRRRPIYIECINDAVMLQPEEIQLSEDDFIFADGPNNPLAAALRAAREYLVKNRYADGKDNGEPYPLLLVRPEGIGAYYAARHAMTSWGAEFGYELVDADWKIAYRPIDPGLKEAMTRAVDEARRRSLDRVKAAPGLMDAEQRKIYRSAFAAGRMGGGQGQGDGLVGGGGAGGDRMLGGNSGGRGGYPGGSSSKGRGRFNEFAGGGGNGGSSSSLGLNGSNQRGYPGGVGGGGGGPGGGGYGGGAGGSGSPSGDDVASLPYNQIAPGGGNGGVGNGPGGNNAGGNGSTKNNGKNDAAGKAGGSTGPGGGAAQGSEQPTGGGASGTGRNGGSGASGSGARGSGSSAGGNGGTSAAGSSSGSAGGGSAGAAGGDSGQGGGQSVSANSDPSNQSASVTVKPESMAKKRGRDWSLPEKVRNAMPLTRPISVSVTSDRLTLISESRNPLLNKTITLGPNTEDSVDEIVKQVWSQIGAWNLAGDGMYWRPVLVVTVGPGGQQRFDDLQALLADSGLDIRQKTATVVPARSRR